MASLANPLNPRVTAWERENSDVRTFSRQKSQVCKDSDHHLCHGCMPCFCHAICKQAIEGLRHGDA